MAKIVVSNAIPRFEEFRFRNNIEIEISDNQNFALVGPNGAGKSQLTDIMLGNIALRSGVVEITKNGEHLPRTKTAFMSFRDIYRMSDTSGTYYQQRWNATENEETPIVRDILRISKYPHGEELVKQLKIESILDKRLLFLSSGELRKMQITKALLQEPEVLVIKNPYIGLDAPSRNVVNKLLQDISEQRGTQIGLLLSNVRDIPSFVDVVVPVFQKSVFPAMTAKQFIESEELNNTLFQSTEREKICLPDTRTSNETAKYDVVIRMNEVNVRYYTKQILRNVSWEVRRGEKWALLGSNGCGKSTLLSLVCGDNPQGYANDITLFDRRRGSGESIWDIKKHIGYLSPDMHTYYQKDIPCIDVVASGFFDTIGLYRQPKEEQRILAMQWMRLFSADHLANRSFLRISYGEQRLILLTRVFVKQPSLVILDEPLHGLDGGKKLLAKQIIETYCSRHEITLIYVTHYENEIPEIVSLRKTLTKPE